MSSADMLLSHCQWRLFSSPMIDAITILYWDAIISWLALRLQASCRQSRFISSLYDFTALLYAAALCRCRCRQRGFASRQPADAAVTLRQPSREFLPRPSAFTLRRSSADYVPPQTHDYFFSSPVIFDDCIVRQPAPVRPLFAVIVIAIISIITIFSGFHRLPSATIATIIRIAEYHHALVNINIDVFSLSHTIASHNSHWSFHWQADNEWPADLAIGHNSFQ